MVFLRAILLFVVFIFNCSIFATDTKAQVKDWNFIVYLVSNNDLEPFAVKNINEMISVGSNDNVNILIQVDSHGKNEACRYLINKDAPVLLDVQSNNYQSTSGTQENLYRFVEWAITNFPAHHNALILWDHGSGIEDPHVFGKLSISYPHDIFILNKKTGFIELNRKLVDSKGIGFNEVFQTYLTNYDLYSCMHRVYNNLLNRKKLDILGMDACFMSMVEIGSQVKDFVSIMIGSQEVEPATGWKYDLILDSFKTQTFTPKDLSKHIVTSYKNTYQNTYIGYTLSAIDLENHVKLEANINEIAEALILLFERSDKNMYMNALKVIRNSNNLTTSFINKNYIDLYHFYSSLLETFSIIEDSVENNTGIVLLEYLIRKGIVIIKDSIIKNVKCHGLCNANGISIYFPTRDIHDSYLNTNFSKNTYWTKFLKDYLSL